MKTGYWFPILKFSYFSKQTIFQKNTEHFWTFLFFLFFVYLLPSIMNYRSHNGIQEKKQLNKSEVFRSMFFVSTASQSFFLQKKVN